MGYIKNECMVVSGWTENGIRRAHSQACQIFNEAKYGSLVSPIMSHIANAGACFFIGVDGSKEGWESSTVCEKARAELILYLKESGGLDWALIQLGGDDAAYCVTNSPNGEEL